MSMNFSGSSTKPLAPLSSPKPPPPPETRPAKPLAPEEGPNLVRGAHTRGVLFEPSEPLAPSTYAVAGAFAAASSALPQLSPAEKPPLSNEQRRAGAVYGRVAEFI
jgi:hypothetical protein